ncbi:MAG: LOG family protein [Candidatus Doudnabacteria bacterium]|nr:LOG family protein [Candidatus Doudnabacteria bacterium]
MQYKIAVSGSAIDNCSPGAFKKAYEVGREIAKQRCVLVTGATIGVPAWSTRGAKSVGGISIGLSPAVSRQAHVHTYKLPTKYMDLIIYTGFDYSGRNMLMTRASDAVITICGRIGTLNEFTTAFEEKRVVGVLTGTGGVESGIEEILKLAKRGRKLVIFESDPKKLVTNVIKKLKELDKQKTASRKKEIN